MTSELFFSFMTSLLICMALIPPLRMLADRFHFMDQPGERKVHEHPIPRVGGIAFAAGACASIAIKPACGAGNALPPKPVSYTHLRAHETVLDLVCRLLLEKKNNTRTW